MNNLLQRIATVVCFCLVVIGFSMVAYGLKQYHSQGGAVAKSKSKSAFSEIPRGLNEEVNVSEPIVREGKSPYIYGSEKVENFNQEQIGGYVVPLPKGAPFGSRQYSQAGQREGPVLSGGNSRFPEESDDVSPHWNANIDRGEEEEEYVEPIMQPNSGNIREYRNPNQSQINQGFKKNRQQY